MKIHNPGIPIANSRKIGLPRNETTCRSVITPSSPWKRALSHRAALSSSAVSGPSVVTWCSSSPNGMPTSAIAMIEQRGPQLVATERSEFDGNWFG